MGEIVPFGCPYCCPDLPGSFSAVLYVPGIGEYTGTIYQNPPPYDPCGYYGILVCDIYEANFGAIFCTQFGDGNYGDYLKLWATYVDPYGNPHDRECYILSPNCTWAGGNDDSSRLRIY